MGIPVSRQGGQAGAALLPQHVFDPAVEALGFAFGGGAVG
jgi:hypothetical protein